MSSEELFELAQRAATLLDLSQHLLLKVSGPDAKRYLHGRLTQNINQLLRGQGTATLLLTPQGRIQGKAIVLAEVDHYLVLADPGQSATPEAHFIKALLQFKVADQVEAASLASSHSLLSIQGPQAEAVLRAAGVSAIPHTPYGHTAASLGGVLTQVISSHRSTAGGFDLLLPHYAKEQVQGVLEEAMKSFRLRKATEEVRTMLRIAAKIPEVGADLDEKVLATEIPVEDLVAFNKGCYAGQEAVEMSIARGRPNRRLALLTGKAEAFPPGTELFSDPEVTRSAGSAGSVCYFPSRGLVAALGLIKSSLDEGAELYMASATGAAPIKLTQSEAL